MPLIFKVRSKSEMNPKFVSGSVSHNWVSLFFSSLLDFHVSTVANCFIHIWVSLDHCDSLLINRKLLLIAGFIKLLMRRLHAQLTNLLGKTLLFSSVVCYILSHN